MQRLQIKKYAAFSMYIICIFLVIFKYSVFSTHFLNVFCISNTQNYVVCPSPILLVYNPKRVSEITRAANTILFLALHYRSTSMDLILLLLLWSGVKRSWKTDNNKNASIFYCMLRWAQNFWKRTKLAVPV